ncbi:Enhancer of mRNA-decapping protein 4 homolog [Eumeta japonica]|uniref:Enhancer of mRNA-decapping protein 4 homolog n=1 Tax=Eumeta variegata TaxID=151549 RepID=A0A4C1Z669_EUMVA|nr:Enhancer of mRNA-decapping protein 4 homolog [Eumeta japonica]
MHPSKMLPKPETTQTISFSEGDGVYSSEVFASDVMVTTNAGTHNHGSSKVKLKSIVDYNWEPKFYTGQLLAVHMNGKYLAYSIKAANPANPGTWNGMVRVIYSSETGSDQRALIKGMQGEGIARGAKATWGLSPEIVRTIYAALIELHVRFVHLGTGR